MVWFVIWNKLIKTMAEAMDKKMLSDFDSEVKTIISTVMVLNMTLNSQYFLKLIPSSVGIRRRDFGIEFIIWWMLSFRTKRFVRQLFPDFRRTPETTEIVWHFRQSNQIWAQISLYLRFHSLRHKLLIYWIVYNCLRFLCPMNRWRISHLWHTKWCSRLPFRKNLIEISFEYNFNLYELTVIFTQCLQTIWLKANKQKLSFRTALKPWLWKHFLSSHIRVR